jgi:hypothetical protein
MERGPCNACFALVATVPCRADEAREAEAVPAPFDATRHATPGRWAARLIGGDSGHAPVAPYGERDEHGQEAGDPGDRAAK